MSAGTYNWELEQGATLDKTITWKDPAGVGIDITGYTIRMQVRATKHAATTILDLDNAAKGGITITDAANGVFKVQRTAAQTAALAIGAYLYDLEMEDPSGNVTRLIEGNFCVVGEVTK